MATKRQRRKRKRRLTEGAASPSSQETATEPPSAPAANVASPKRKTDGPPPPPWGSFPLTELVILVGIVLLVAGYFVEPPRGNVMLGIGLTLAALGGLELSAREHFAGYKSHTLLLAGSVGVATIAILAALARVQPGIAVICGVAAFALSAWPFANAFRRRSGGALFRFRA